MTLKRQPLLTTEHQFIKRNGKTLGRVRFRSSPDGRIGFWEVLRLDSKVWEGEHETLLEAEGYLTGDAR